MADAFILGGGILGVGAAAAGVAASSPALLIGGLVGGVAAIGGGLARLWNGPAPAPARALALAPVATALSDATGYRDIATFIVAQRADASFAVYGQRGYENARQTGEILEAHGLPAEIPFVYADGSDQPNIHAEMLAVSEWLLGKHPEPRRLGASRPVCHDCAIVLNHLGIAFEGAAGGRTPNWVSPYLNAHRDEPAGLAGRVPRRRTRGREYDD